MPSYYYPEVTYQYENTVAFPDHSRELPGADGVIRAFWRSGEQMWDEAFNNSLEWLGRWPVMHVYNRWQSPRYPWYSPRVSRYTVEPDHNRDEEGVLHASVINYTDPMAPDFYFKPWSGQNLVVLADRVFIGYHGGKPETGGDWWGITNFQEHVDEIEVAFFFSETRPNRIVGMHTVVEPFRLHPQTYSSRVRGWPVATGLVGPLQILKNGVQVGTAWKAEFSSGMSIIGGLPIEFEAGDVMAIKTPPGSGVIKGVAVSIVGELL